MTKHCSSHDINDMSETEEEDLESTICVCGEQHCTEHGEHKDEP